MNIKKIIFSLTIISLVALLFGIINNNSFLNYLSLSTLMIYSVIIAFIERKDRNKLEQKILDQEYEYFNKEVELRNTITVLQSELETSKRFCRLNEIQIEDLGNKVMNYITENSKLKKENEKLNELIIQGNFNNIPVIHEEIKTKPKTIRKSPRNKSKKNETDNK